ncbi:hypothetical protein EHQ58_10150 [Leptospira ognonensis]|uniref:Uncharacterized protein n=1 Tax=Leptospira ognonensis TaxID=2484945 RepID=A0A4R9JZ84_9LEPT|nr:hypothetical protein [Leptospira ognonensis]TGL58672.1 hypothetical protein EHQ58_10150 [Leptospira ognonensis]
MKASTELTGYGLFFWEIGKIIYILSLHGIYLKHGNRLEQLKQEAKQKQFPRLPFELVATEIIKGRFTYGFKKSNKSEKVIIVELPWIIEKKYQIRVAVVIDK